MNHGKTVRLTKLIYYSFIQIQIQIQIHIQIQIQIPGRRNWDS